MTIASKAVMVWVNSPSMVSQPAPSSTMAPAPMLLMVYTCPLPVAAGSACVNPPAELQIITSSVERMVVAEVMTRLATLVPEYNCSLLKFHGVCPVNLRRLTKLRILAHDCYEAKGF